MAVSKKYIKLVRFVKIYGVSRTLIKIYGRIRPIRIKKLYLKRKPQVSLVGCGQFGYATISYFISRLKGNVFYSCFDIDSNNSNSLKKYFGYRKVTETAKELLEDPKVEILYIASNHASHTEYAVKAMMNGVKKIYIEKPIATSFSQLESLLEMRNEKKATLYAGYNRPYSKAILKLRDIFISENIHTPITLNCFVSGHLIPEDHWYRNEEEGTRICGNMGHWIDLMVHILCWRDLPQTFDIGITYSNIAEPDDNLTISITTEKGDLIILTLTARGEPFDGINETINFQGGNVIAKIDDFRSMKVWRSEQAITYKFFPKDVGHKNAINQPFQSSNRDFKEIIVSTLLMLHITDMVRSKQKDLKLVSNRMLEKYKA